MGYLAAEPPELELTVYDLRLILDQLGKAQEAGVHFTGELIAGRHAVAVRWTNSDDQRDGSYLVITGFRRV